MKEIKQFRGGGLDKDSAPEDIAPNDVAGGYNVRFTGTEEGEEGYATDIESNVLIPSTRSAGINKAIGAFGFETVRKGYSIIYNSAGFHLITELNYDTRTETILFTNKTNSGGIDIMPLDPQFYVNDMKLLQDKFLVFTDGKSEVYYINLERLKSGELGVITKDDIRLIKAPSLVTPIAYFGDDASRSINLLKGNLFQFRVQYVYLDGEHSAWSSMSKRMVHAEENTPVNGTDVGRANNLVVAVNAGSNRVKTINVGARIGMLDFMLIKSIERKEVITITDDTFATPSGLFEKHDPSQSGIYEVYNVSTNTYSFTFYNDALYPNIDVLETDLDYDHIAEKVGSLELLNGNVLALADLTKGKPRPVVDVTLTQTSYNPNISTVISPVTNSFKIDTYTRTTEKIRGLFNGFKDEYYRYEIAFSGLVKTGDKVEFVIQTGNFGEIRERTEVIATTLENNNNLLFIQKIIKELPRPASYRVSGSQIILIVSLKTINQSGFSTREQLYTTPKVILALAGTGQSKSIHSLKTNSSYQLALGHKDRYGRLFPIVTNNLFILKTQSLAQLEGQIPRFNWKLNTTLAPTGAESYQWLMCENTTHQSNLYVNGVLDTTNTDADYLVFKVNSLDKFNKNNTSSVLAYAYTPGDRCTFVWVQPATGSKVWFNTPNKLVDVEVVGYEARVTPAAGSVPAFTDYLLKVRKSSAITSGNLYNTQTIAGVDILMEVYTPRKRTDVIAGKTTYKSTVFYEIGEEYPIVNGQYSLLSGDISEGDVYYKTRQYVNSTNASDLRVYEVEDFNFSDFYKSNFTSYGRARTYEDETGVKRLKSSIRYSGESREGDTLNSITRFFIERIYGNGAGETSPDHGAVQKIFQRDNYLICIQETKTGHIPVYSSILEDNEGVENVTISDRILGNIRYIQSGKFGMGGAKESFATSTSGAVYWIDANNSMPVRNGYDGVSDISGKLSKYWRRVIHQANKEGKKFIGFFDELNKEYIISIEGSGDIVTSIPFTDTDWSFTETYVVNPATLVSTGATNGTVSINTVTGKALFTPATNYFGNGGFSFSFVNDGITINRNTCGVITAGTKTVDDFVFIDLTGVQVNTQYESNGILVSGNTVGSAVSITGGEFSVNGGAYTSIAGTVFNGDIVKVRLTTTASYGTANNAVLTIFGKSDTFTATTRAAVAVNYTVAYGINPHTQTGLIFTRNNIEVARFGNEITGTLTNMFGEGDLIGIRNYTYGVATFPWEANSKSNLNVKVGTVVRFNADVLVQAIELQADSFVIAAGSAAITAIATGSSTATGYISRVLNVVSNTTAVRATITDNSPPKTVLYLNNSIQASAGTQVYPYNLLSDANTQKLLIENLSASVSISVVVNGGAAQVIAALGSFTFNAIAKNSITLNIV